MSLSLPSSASTSMSSPKEDTVAPLSPQDIKSIIDDDEEDKEGSIGLRLCLCILSNLYFINSISLHMLFLCWQH